MPSKLSEAIFKFCIVEFLGISKRAQFCHFQRSAFMNFRGFHFSRGEFLMKTFSIFLIGKFIFDGKHKEDEEPKNIGKMATFNQKFTF